MKRRNKILASAAAIVMLAASLATPAFAEEKTDTGEGSVSGSVTLNGTIMPLTISVTHPVNAVYAISPDAEAFTAPEITVTNNSKVAVIATVESLKAAPGGSLTFTDVDPSAKIWRSLNLADSKKYIALGVTAKAKSGWSDGYNTATHWAADSTPFQIGTLNSGASGALNLTADYGLAFDSSYTSNHNLVFSFQLA